MKTFSPLVPPQVVVMATANDDKVGILTTLGSDAMTFHLDIVKTM